MEKRCLTVLVFFLAFLQLKSQTAQNITEVKEKLTLINNQIAESFLHNDNTIIMGYYDEAEPVCMPEYHNALYSKKDIESYYKQWLSNFKINDYKRSIYEVQLIENYAVEIGTFHINTVGKNGVSLVYDGKYMNVWKVLKNKKLVLVSEIWGADKAIDGSQFSVIKSNITKIPKPKINQSIEEEVYKRNERIIALVKRREGEKHAVEFFTKDAIYLTYDTPMLIGMENIKPYFIEHEKPNGIAIDSLSIKASRIILLKNFIIEYGYYFVDVSWDNKKGKASVSGKSINLWKREENGLLMLYRQMVNHN
ncbi:nuclear transport factor 2 family protein [Flavobacterium artemisiae]|uniref:Nuclear transport factor 2 family protein n=1 Tax=Flavobacterium artemisiae TaxID=2126556 RepID=A0ABW4HGC4_9FLAO